jgi:hypothetical protein
LEGVGRTCAALTIGGDCGSRRLELARRADGEVGTHTFGDGYGGLIKDNRLELEAVVTDGTGVFAKEAQHRGGGRQRVGDIGHGREEDAVRKIVASHIVDLNG